MKTIMQDPLPTKRIHNLIIVDESGSMSVIRKQAFTGMNETLQTVRQMQEKYPDQVQLVTLLTFDSGHTTWHYDNASALMTKDLSWKAYNPGGGTPLYDAIGKGISKVNAQIEDGDHVLVTIITDGEENSSEEWTLKMVRTMIEKLKKQNWTFTLIGTDNLDVETMAVLCRGKATKGRAPQMVRTAIRNQVFNLSDLIIAPVLY